MLEFMQLRSSRVSLDLSNTCRNIDELRLILSAGFGEALKGLNE